MRQELFLPSARHNLKPASSPLFLFVTGISFKVYAKQASLQASKYVDILSEFFAYSVELKRMAEISPEAEKQHVLKFLNSLNCTSDAWSEISAKDIWDYVRVEFQGLK